MFGLFILIGAGVFGTGLIGGAGYLISETSKGNTEEIKRVFKCLVKLTVLLILFLVIIHIGYYMCTDGIFDLLEFLSEKIK